MHSKVENTYNSVLCWFVLWAIQNSGVRVTRKQNEKEGWGGGVMVVN